MKAHFDYKNLSSCSVLKFRKVNSISFNRIRIPDFGLSMRIYRSSFLILLVGVLTLISGCDEPPIEDVNLDEVEFAPFVEEEFPFITTSLLISKDESLYPKNNVAARCLALILGEGAYACFDTDMLRWAAAWTGDFVPLEGVSHKSYADYLGRNDEMPWLTETPKVVTGLYPGWNTGEPMFSDPRRPSPHPEEPSWGPLPQEQWRWNGIYITDGKPVLSYSVGGVDIYETPGSLQSGEETVFTRTFRIENPDHELSVVAAEIPEGSSAEASSGRIEIQHEGGDIVSVMILEGEADNAEIYVTDDRYVYVQIQPEDQILEFTLNIWSGSAGQSDEVEQVITNHDNNLTTDYTRGAAHLWPEVVRTRGKISPDTSAYVIDELTLPIPNPWNRNVRVVDVDFFEDGRAAVVTFEGDVWKIEGIDRDLGNLRWQRFASGLYEPQSIEIVNEQIYVYGKDGILRLQDLNGNGFADYYENFSNLIEQSIETREWASDFVARPGGGFYVAKGAALDMGPAALTEPVDRGIRAGSNHSGVILEISEDGRNIDVIASGLRGPYLGIHPQTGLLTASDQEGHHVPSSPILAVERGDYYGVSATAHRDPVPEITPPLMWIPHNVDRSGTSQVWITSEEMGPMSGELIHFSYGRPGLFHVVIDSSDSGIQGGTSFIDAHYPMPTMKGTVHPEDGQLYIGGFTLWGTNSEGMTGLLRMRYTNQAHYLPKGFRARDGGIVLRFHEELNEEQVGDISNYRVERWNYLRSEEYGSGHYRLDGSPGQEILPVYSAHLSDDGKAVYLAIPNIEVAEQMQVNYNLSSSDGTPIENTFWFSVHHTDSLDLPGEGFSGIDPEELLADMELVDIADEVDEEISAERGREIFQRVGCMGCHTTDGSAGTGVGPTLQGVYGNETEFRDGTSTIADEEYLREKLYRPAERIVDGYDEGMPSFLGILSEAEVESIILYMKTLEE